MGTTGYNVIKLCSEICNGVMYNVRIDVEKMKKVMSAEATLGYTLKFKVEKKQKLKKQFEK